MEKDDAERALGDLPERAVESGDVLPRLCVDLSQQRLAEAMDVSRQTINSIEKERYTPSLPLAMALARHFDKTVEDVFHADA